MTTQEKIEEMLKKSEAIINAGQAIILPTSAKCNLRKKQSAKFAQS